MADCNQTNIPTVDNTELECDEFVKDLCVKFENANPYLMLPQDSNLRETVDSLIRIIQNNQRLINSLRVDVDQLRTEVDQLRTDVDTYHP